MYTVEVCVDFEGDISGHMARALQEDVFMHTILLTNSAIRDYAQRRSPTKATQFYLSKTLSLLSERLGDKDSHLMDSTIYIVLSLAVMGAIFGDYAATRTHLLGLMKIIELRGGLQYLQTQPKVQFKLESADLVWCLAFGGQPLFLVENSCWNPLYKPLPSLEGRIISQEVQDDLFDPRLLLAFRDLQYLTHRINECYENNTRLHAPTCQPIYTSFQIRLLKLKDSAMDELSECFCLGTLAFLSTTFQLPGRRLEYSYLAGRLQKSCQTLDTTKPELQPLIFWLLMVCGISVFDATESWLRTTWKIVMKSQISWKEAKQRLRSVMWIPSIQDQLGKQLFSMLASQTK